MDLDKIVLPCNSAILNAQCFLKTLKEEGFETYSDCYPSPYGSIILGFETLKGLVSIEIGNGNRMGWFTDFFDEHNYASDGVVTDFKTIPENLKHIRQEKLIFFRNEKKF